MWYAVLSDASKGLVLVARTGRDDGGTRLEP